MLISSDMSWSPHIDSVRAKAQQRLGFIRRNLRGSPQECKRLAYLALVRSGLEYASVIWDPHLQVDIDKLEKVQRKGARWVTSTYARRASVTELLETLKWDSLQERRRQQRLIFLFKILNDDVAVPAQSVDLVLNIRPTRGDQNLRKLKEPACRSTLLEESFVHKTLNEWNLLPQSVVSADSVSTFKSRLAKSSASQ